MLIYTVVASLSPVERRGGRGHPSLPPPAAAATASATSPRQQSATSPSSSRAILASYTALSYTGNFEEVAKKLIHAIPAPPSPSPMSPRTQPQLSRYQCGSYFFNQLLTHGDRGGLVFLCMSDGANEDVFDYLFAIRASVVAALDALPRGEAGGLERVRRAASLALVESLNRFMRVGDDKMKAANAAISPKSRAVVSASLTALNEHSGLNGSSASSFSPSNHTFYSGTLDGRSEAAALVQAVEQLHAVQPQAAAAPPSAVRGERAVEWAPGSRPQSLPARRSYADLLSSAPLVRAPTPPGAAVRGRAPSPPPSSVRTMLPHNPNVMTKWQQFSTMPPGAAETTDSGLSESQSANRSVSQRKRMSPHPPQHTSPRQWPEQLEHVPASPAFSFGSNGSGHLRSNSDPERSRSLMKALEGSPTYAGQHSSPSEPDLLGMSLRAQPQRRTTVAEERLWRRRTEMWTDGAAAGPDLSSLSSSRKGVSPMTSPNAVSSGIRSGIIISQMRVGEPPAGAAAAEKGGTVGILLPLDYSGMEELASSSMLHEVDGMLRNAIQCQLSDRSSLDDMLTILVKFRDDLSAIILPRPATVDFDQALKDARRESIVVNGQMFRGDTDSLLSRLKELLSPLVFEEVLVDQVCQDIVRASSRTASGGDTYSAMMTLLARPEAGYLLVPCGVESSPISVNIDGSKGEVVISVENSFYLRRGVDDEGAADDRGKKGKRRLLRNTFRDSINNIIGGRQGFNKATGDRRSDSNRPSQQVVQPTMGDAEGGFVQLDGRLEVFLSLLNRSCKRRLAVSSPLVEQAPPQVIALGAGSPEVNGTFDLIGWQNDAPLYINSRSSTTITQAELGGCRGWVIGTLPNRIFYGTPDISMMHPPDAHWSVMSGGVGQDPPPTLMMSYQKRVNQKVIDIRDLPTPRWNQGAHFPSSGATDNLTVK